MPRNLDRAGASGPATGRIRLGGAVCLATSVLGAVICGYLTSVGEVAAEGPFAYPSALPDLTALQMVLPLSQLGLIVGLLALSWTGAVPDTRRARVGRGVAVTVLAGLVVAEGVAISVPVSALDATPPAFGLVYSGYTLLLGVALLAVGSEFARGGAWPDARRWLLSVLGLWLIVPGLPAQVLGHEAAGWPRAAWLVLFALLGLALVRVDPDDQQGQTRVRGGSAARNYAIVTWVYVAAFGSAAIPVVGFLIQNDRLPSFFDIFDMYGGPRVEQLETAGHVLIILAFLGVTLLAAWASWLVRNGSRPGALLGLVLIPLEATFWWVFLTAALADRRRQDRPARLGVAHAHLAAGPAAHQRCSDPPGAP